MLAVITFASAVAAAAAVSFTATLPSNLQNTTSLNFPILDCVGSSHGAMALRADYREHLTRVQRDIGFKRIRGHGASWRRVRIKRVPRDHDRRAV